MTANSAPTNIGVVNFMNSLPTRSAVSRLMESNGPRNALAMYASLTPCHPSFTMNASTAKVNGTMPIANTSCGLISNWIIIIIIGISVAGITASRQFIVVFFMDSNIS